MERGGVGGARPAGAGDESGLPAGRFAGFPSSGRATPVPNLFFARLLPDIERAEELLVTLYIFYIQGLQRRSPFFVTGSELAADGTLVRALSNLCGEGGEALGRGLALATERGSLLRVEVKGDGRTEEAYLPATPYNRRVAERLAETELRLGEPLPPAAPTPPPNIFALYEENIGAITPLIADQLKDAEERYPAQWIEAAFREAVSLNKRSWRYIEAILRRYEAEGPDYEEAERDPEADWLERRYARGKRGAGRLR